MRGRRDEGGFYDTRESLLLTSRELGQKLRRIAALSILLTLSLLVTCYGSGLLRVGKSPKQAAKEQALAYYSSLAQKQHWRPSGLFKGKQSAVILILCRNSDLADLLPTLDSYEKKFNSRFKYPYLLLNNEEFDGQFVQAVQRKIRSWSNAKVEFGLVPQEHWSYPEHIDQERAADGRLLYKERGTVYGDSESYRFMCRYYSGFFYDHPLILKYQYYWRVEPGVKFLCKIPVDPFRQMHEQDKKYGYLIQIQEIPETIPTLWRTTQEFMDANPHLVDHNSNALEAFKHSDSQYNQCHFWSNFEIADLSFFRSPPYRKYFAHLDAAGGFFYERWGDAPIHTLAVGMFLRHEQVLYFDDIGYRHAPFNHCPVDAQWRIDQQCDCDPFDTHEQSHNQCQRNWTNFIKGERTEPE